MRGPLQLSAALVQAAKQGLRRSLQEGVVSGRALRVGGSLQLRKYSDSKNVKLSVLGSMARSCGTHRPFASKTPKFSHMHL